VADLTLLAFANAADFPPCTCDGRGWTIVEQDGREVARQCARCHGQRLVRQFGGQLRTWASWVPRPELKKQVEALRAWRGMDEWSCLLWGGPGSGKSHACQAVGHEWLARGLGVRYVVVPEYLNRVRKSFDDDSVSVPDLESFDGLLVLDELALGKTTEWVAETLERAIGFRYRSSLPTLLASNADLNVLGVQFPRLTDRLFEGLLLHWQASSWRRR
jgi:DNA replication protein DnaC